MDDDISHSALFDDVLAAVTFTANLASPPELLDLKYPRDYTWTPSQIEAIFEKITTASSKDSFLPKIPSPNNVSDNIGILDADSTLQLTFWDLDGPQPNNIPLSIGELLAHEASKNVIMSTRRDNTIQGGVVKSDIRSSRMVLAAPYPIEKANLVYVGDEKILNSFNVVQTLQSGGLIVLKLAGLKDDEVEKKLPSAFRKDLADKNARLLIIDPTTSTAAQENSESAAVIVQLSLLSLVRKDLITSEGLRKAVSLQGDPRHFESLIEDAKGCLRDLEIPESWATLEVEKDASRLSYQPSVNSFTPYDTSDIEPAGAASLLGRYCQSSGI